MRGRPLASKTTMRTECRSRTGRCLDRPATLANEALARQELAKKRATIAHPPPRWPDPSRAVEASRARNAYSFADVSAAGWANGPPRASADDMSAFTQSALAQDAPALFDAVAFASAPADPVTIQPGPVTTQSRSLTRSGHEVAPLQTGRPDRGRSPSVSEDQTWGAANAAMDRYADGDDSAFAGLYAALAPRLLPYVRRCAGDPAAASDLLQQTMLQLHLTRARFLRGANVIPWAFAIARRAAIDEARRTRRSIPPAFQSLHESNDEPVTGPTAEEELQAVQLARRAGAQLARLSEAQRAAFHLTRIEGLSVREVAQRLGTSANAVKLRTHRAHVALRAALNEPDEGERGVG